MKKITFLITLLISCSIFSQSLPLDFEPSEDDAFSGFGGSTASVITDPTNSTNKVLQIIGNGAEFDGAVITLDTYVDLSNDSNNTITLNIWAPDATTRTHLLKLEGSTTGATELYFTTSASGWQTATINFSSGLANDYPSLVIFTDAGVGNTATGTYYIDNITGTNGTMVPVDPLPSSPATTPTTPNAEVLSIYGDTGGYTNLWTKDYYFGSDQGEIDLGSGSANNARKFNLSVAGYGEGTNAITNISSYSYIQFDYWADSNSTEIKFFIMDKNPAVKEYYYTISNSGGNAVIANETWTHIEIPLSFFENNASVIGGGTGGFSKSHFFQWKIDATSDLVSDFVYVDNIYFTQQPLSIKDFTFYNFSIYPNPSNNNWNITSHNQNIVSVEVFDVLGKRVMALTPNTTEVKISTANLNNGMYLAKVNTSNGTQTLKLIKN